MVGLWEEAVTVVWETRAQPGGDGWEKGGGCVVARRREGMRRGTKKFKYLSFLALKIKEYSLA